MRRGLVTLAAIAALTAPATATADYQPADSYPQLAGALEVARAAWPDSPCRGREMVRFLPGAESSLGFAAKSPTGFAAGLAYRDGTCRIDLSDRISGYDLCEVLVHEAGHLAGHEHSADPTSVMRAAPTGRYEPCQTAMLPPVTSRDVRRAVLSNGLIRLGVPKIRVTRCRPTSHNAGVCRIAYRSHTATISVARRGGDLVEPSDDELAQQMPALARRIARAR